MAHISAPILGDSAVAKLQDRAKAPVLRIGDDAFSRGDLAAVECFSFTAAANLSRILSHELAARDTRDVFENVHPMALALPRLGVISLFVLGAAFEARGLGGDRPLESWILKHRAPEEKSSGFVTFGTMKHHQLAQESSPSTRRRRARRSTSTRRPRAHRLRVGRITKRPIRTTEV